MVQIGELEHEQGLVRVEVTGEHTPGREMAEAASVWTRVAESCRERQVRKILAIWHAPATFPTADGFDIGSDPGALFGWERTYALAVVHMDQAPRAQELYRFVENVAHNHGYSFRSFSSEAAARAWLDDA